MKRIIYLLIIASNLLHAQSAYDAIKNCDLTSLKNYMSKGFKIDSFQFDSNYKTALMVAAEAGCTKIVQHLLDNDADTDTIHYLIGVTALELAATGNHKDIVELLINHGAKVDIDDIHGSPLTTAAFKGHLEIAKLLIKAGADVNAMGMGPPVEIKNCIFSGGTPLMFAAVYGYEQVVKELIKAGADVNLDVFGQNVDALEFRQSALTIAAENNYLNIVKLLIKSGANAFGTLLNCAYYKGVDANIARNLVKAGVKINNQNENGMTPLMVAAWQGNIDVVKLLVDNNADIKIKENNNLTAFMLACYSREEEIAKILFNKGAVKGEKETDLLKIMDLYAWNTIQILNTVWSYKQYVELYPEGSGITQAKTKLKEIEKNEWEKARTTNTMESYKEFLDKFPDGDFHSEANLKFKELDIKENPWKNAPLMGRYEFDSYKSDLIKKYLTYGESFKIEFKNSSDKLIATVNWDSTSGKLVYRDAEGKFDGTGKWIENSKHWEYRNATNKYLGLARWDDDEAQWEFFNTEGYNFLTVTTPATDEKKKAKVQKEYEEQLRKEKAQQEYENKNLKDKGWFVSDIMNSPFDDNDLYSTRRLIKLFVVGNADLQNFECRYEGKELQLSATGTVSMDMGVYGTNNQVFAGFYYEGYSFDISKLSYRYPKGYGKWYKLEHKADGNREIVITF